MSNFKKIGDLSVKVGEYEKDGVIKGKYVSIGALMADEDGKMFGFMERTFNPAGVPLSDKEKNGQFLFNVFTKERVEDANKKTNQYQQSAPIAEDIPF